MTVTHATWEKRNLGVDCNEITIDKDDEDNIEQLRAEIDKNTLEYTVVKVSAGMVPVMFMLEDLGFHFIESIIIMSHDLMNYETLSPKTLKRLAASYSLHRLDESEHERIYTEIRKGIFDTDRVYLDPYFDKILAAQRYIGWMQDAYKDGMDIYEFIHKDIPVGFTQYKVNENYGIKATLLGLYKDANPPAGGVICNYLSLSEAVSQGAKMKLNTCVSTNNPKSIRSMLAVGYQFEETQYVYIKHM